MQTKASIQQKLDEIRAEYGEWSFDIPLPFDIWTRGNLQIAHTRLRRLLQVVSDLSRKPLSECRILDLGCLDGMFSIEFALHGAKTVGVEVREANFKRAVFCKEALELDNLEFRQEDVRHLSPKAYGEFDAIVCSGILYHLPALDAIDLINTMYQMVKRVVVIDSHVSLLPQERFVYEGEEYWGVTYREYPDDTPPEVIEKAIWSSAGNPTSFWFTRPSLINLLAKAGFSSVHECFNPMHFDPRKPGMETIERCTFAAIKEKVCEIKTSPAVNRRQDKWPERTLSYAPSEP
jgi:SAM-dependent methyltransferase